MERAIRPRKIPGREGGGASRLAVDGRQHSRFMCLPAHKSRPSLLLSLSLLHALPMLLPQRQPLSLSRLAALARQLLLPIRRCLPTKGRNQRLNASFT